MGKRRDPKGTERVGDLVDQLGPERRALFAKRTSIVLLQACSTACLLAAIASLAGYLPHAVGPAILLVLASVAGFVLAAAEARRP